MRKREGRERRRRRHSQFLSLCAASSRLLAIVVRRPVACPSFVPSSPLLSYPCPTHPALHRPHSVYIRIRKSVTGSQDYHGFMVNRILMQIINKAFWTLHTGVATKADRMKLDTNHSMDPLQLADFIGLDFVFQYFGATQRRAKYFACISF